MKDQSNVQLQNINTSKEPFKDSLLIVVYFVQLYVQENHTYKGKKTKSKKEEEERQTKDKNYNTHKHKLETTVFEKLTCKVTPWASENEVHRSPAD